LAKHVVSDRVNVDLSASGVPMASLIPRMQTSIGRCLLQRCSRDGATVRVVLQRTPQSLLHQSINQSINLFVMKHSRPTSDIAVTALTGTTRLKSAYGSPK